MHDPAVVPCLMSTNLCLFFYNSHGRTRVPVEQVATYSEPDNAATHNDEGLRPQPWLGALAFGSRMWRPPRSPKGLDGVGSKTAFIFNRHICPKEVEVPTRADKGDNRPRTSTSTCHEEVRELHHSLDVRG